MSKRKSGPSKTTSRRTSVAPHVPEVVPQESRWLKVNIGSMAVSNKASDVLTTTAPVGSCVAVCLWEPDAGVAGMLHFELPDSKLDPAQAESQPATFADTGLVLLLDEAAQMGATKGRCKVWLIGGAQIPDRDGYDKWAKRNILAARSVLWKAGVLLDGEQVGGTKARTAILSVSDGTLSVKVDDVAGDVINAGTSKGKED